MTGPESNKAVKPDSVSTKGPKPASKPKAAAKAKPVQDGNPKGKKIEMVNDKKNRVYKDVRTFAANCSGKQTRIISIGADGKKTDETLGIGADCCVTITLS